MASETGHEIITAAALDQFLLFIWQNKPIKILTACLEDDETYVLYDDEYPIATFEWASDENNKLNVLIKVNITDKRWAFNWPPPQIDGKGILVAVGRDDYDVEKQKIPISNVDRASVDYAKIHRGGNGRVETATLGTEKYSITIKYCELLDLPQ